MIAKNYLKHPTALRFQRELFHNGYKNSPRIMRAIECIFKFAPDVPQWVKDATRKARHLVKTWKAGQIVLNFAAAVKTTFKNVLTCRPRFEAMLTVTNGYLKCQGHYMKYCSKCNTWRTYSSADGGEYSNA